MTAADTALRVLSWAAAEEMGQEGRPLPAGDLTSAGELAAPPAMLLGVLSRLASLGAARQRLHQPPLGDRRPPGSVACLVAAAVGARDLGAARQVLRAAVTQSPSALDLAALHAVARHAMRSGELAADLDGLVRDASPLTGVVDYPSAAGTYQAEDVLFQRLLPEPDGRDLAVRTFAEPAGHPRQAQWRADMLARCRHRDLDFVLDVYETGMKVFGAEHRRGLARAAQLLGPHPDLDAARPLVRWWQAMSEIERRKAGVAAIRRRALISREYVTGVRAYRQFRTLEAAYAAGVPSTGSAVRS